jgi:HlyD family secretion protein
MTVSKSKNFGKRLWSVVKFVLMTAGVFFIVIEAYRFAADSGEGEAREPEYQTEKLARGEIETTVSSTGTIAAVGTVEIGTQVSGTIDKVFVDYNDTVKKGQVLAVLDLSLFKSSVSEAKAGLMDARAKLKQAQLECTRNKPLADSGNLSAQEWLSLETARDTAKAAVLSAEAGLKRAETNLDNAKITSPINGTVITRSIEAGQTVAASYSTPTLFVIAEDLKHVQIEANVDESDIGQVKTGQNVRFTVQAYPDEVFKGKVTQIRMKPTTLSNVVTYTVMVDADNENGLLFPGMTATVDFIVARAENALLVPAGALRFRPDMANGGKTADGGGMEGSNVADQTEQRHSPSIYTLDASMKPVKIQVKPGISDGTVTEVSGGDDLKEGMVVITGAKTEKAEAKTNLLSKLAPKPGRGHGAPRGMR